MGGIVVRTGQVKNSETRQEKSTAPVAQAEQQEFHSEWRPTLWIGSSNASDSRAALPNTSKQAKQALYENQEVNKCCPQKCQISKNSIKFYLKINNTA